MVAGSPYTGYDADPRPGDKLVMKMSSGGAHNPLGGGQTYFFGDEPYVPYLIGTSPQRVYIGLSGSVRWMVFLVEVAGTLGSGETGTISLRVNGVTDFVLNTSMLWSAGINGFWLKPDVGVIPLVEDDFVEIKVDTPAWVTLPTGVRYRSWFRIEA